VGGESKENKLGLREGGGSEDPPRANRKKEGRSVALLASLGHDGTGEWSGLALNWEGEIVMALENGADWR
jgi:hypothetical protein